MSVQRSSSVVSPPLLSNIEFDALKVGERMGPFREPIDQDFASALVGPIGERRQVDTAPPAVIPILFLKALRAAMGGIPAGSILAEQDIRLHSPMPVDGEVETTAWVSDKYVLRGRPRVAISFEVFHGDTLAASGRKVIVWPTGPEEESGYVRD